MNYTTYLRWGVVGGLFLILFVPFIVATGNFFPNLFFPYITGKNFAFRILVELVLIMYVLLALREPKYRPRSSLIMWAALAFTMWMGVATALSADPVKSFWSNFERMEGYIAVLHLFVYFCLAGAVLSAHNLWDRFINTSIAASVVQGLYALLQVMGTLTISTQSGLRADTTFGNATYLAVYMMLNTFLTLYMVSRTKSPAMRAVYGVALVLQVAAVFFTQTRGAMLGLVGGLVVAAVYVLAQARGREHQGLRRWAAGGLVGLAVLGAGVFAARDTAVIQAVPGLNRVASISLNDTTTRSRLEFIWPMALRGAMERPLTGWGQENFSYIFNKYYSPEMYNQEQWFDRAHNQFLDWLVAGGVLAFLLYTSFYVLAAWAFWRSDNLSHAERAVLLGLMAGFAFNNLFVFDNLVSAIYFFTLLAFAHSLSKRELPGRIAFTRPVADHTVAIIAPVIGVVLLLGAWAVNGPAMARAQDVIAARETMEHTLDAQGRPTFDAQGRPIGQNKDPRKNIEEFEHALTGVWPGTELGRQETVEQMLQHISSVFGASSAVGPDVKQLALERGFAAGTALLAQRKGDARLELFMGTLLAQFGQSAEAIKYLEQALTHSPHKQQIFFQLGVTYLQAGDTGKALEALKAAFELEPKYDMARILYASGLYYSGQSAEADALLVERYGTAVVDDDQLLQTFRNLKQNARVIDIWKARVAKDPKNTQVLLGLAGAYFESGDKANTIATLQQIIALDPAQAAQVGQVIKQIQDGTLKPGQ